MESKPETHARSETAEVSLPSARPAAPPVVTLQALLDAFEAKGSAIPVAVVTSIFDDLLALAHESRGARDALAFADVLVDRRGFARLGRDKVGHGQLAPLLVRALSGGRAEQAPPSARALLERLQSEDPGDHPVDGEQLRGWLRESLGAPAPRDEVAASLLLVVQESLRWEDSISVPEPVLEQEPEEPRFPAAVLDQLGSALPLEPPVSFRPVDPPVPEASAAAVDPSPAPAQDDPSEAITQPPHPAERPSFLRTKAGDLEPETEQVAPLVPPAAVEPVAAGSAARIAQGPAGEPGEPAVEPGAEGATEAPVVRHTLKLGNVRVPAAPAARRSARPAADPRDSLALPADGGGHLAWIMFLVILAALVALYLRY